MRFWFYFGRRFAGFCCVLVAMVCSVDETAKMGSAGLPVNSCFAFYNNHLLK
ncbi:MAG: hypothetical protein O3A84_02645 [Proteobacteria bacterium]|nr:hypothetical protein [Pseudomonadota bacterium]